MPEAPRLRRMRLPAYLAATGITAAQLAEAISKRLARKISPGTIRAIAQGGGCRTDVAQAIICESIERPAPTGTVTLEDLIRVEPAKRAARR